MNVSYENGDLNFSEKVCFFAYIVAAIISSFGVSFILFLAIYSRTAGNVLESATGMFFWLASPLTGIMIVYYMFKRLVSRMGLTSSFFNKAKNWTATFSLFTLIILSGTGSQYLGERSMQNTAQQSFWELLKEIPVLLTEPFVVNYEIPMLLAMLTAILMLFEKYSSH